MATIGGGMMTIDIEKLKHNRDENFKKLGQYLLQKKYYEEQIHLHLLCPTGCVPPGMECGAGTVCAMYAR